MSVILALLLFGVMGGTIFFVFSRINYREFQASAERIAPEIPPRGVEALSAYQHYLDCNQPQDIIDALEPRGLIVHVGRGRYGITELGKHVGMVLGLYDDVVLVTTFAAQPARSDKD